MQSSVGVAGERDLGVPGWVHSGAPGRPGQRAGLHDALRLGCQGQLPDRRQCLHKCRHAPAPDSTLPCIASAATCMEELFSAPDGETLLDGGSV